MLERVGHHVAIDKFGELSVYQTTLGSPDRYTVPDTSKLVNVHKTVVIHSPYWVSLVRNTDDLLFNRTLGYTVDVSRQMDKVNQIYYVTHVGARLAEMSVSRAAGNIVSFCLQWLRLTEGSNVILGLENDSGSKKGTKMGSVKLLSQIIRQINHPRVRMVFDTEHAFANGFDLSDKDKLKSVKDIIAVVHYNAIPSEVKQGSHLDRHTTTCFDETQNGYEYLHNVYDVLYDNVRPFIIEADYQIALRSRTYMQNYIANRVVQIG